MNSFLEAAILFGAVGAALNKLTADELILRKDGPGLVAISNRHNESVGRVIRQNLQLKL